MKPKVIFMGTPDFATAALEALLQLNLEVVAVVSQPDKPVGRHKQLRMTPVKSLALKHNIPVLQPVKIKESVDEILSFHPDLIVTCAYGQMLPRPLLDVPEFGCINIHASLLPKYRGGAPIHASVMAGDTQTGVTLMKTVMKMDAGPYFAQEMCPISMLDTTETVHDRLMEVAKKAILTHLPAVWEKRAEFIEQDESKVTYAFNIQPKDEVIRFDQQGEAIYNQIRGLSSWPGAYMIVDGKKFKIYKLRYEPKEHSYTKVTFTNLVDDAFVMAVPGGFLHLLEVQLEGKKRQSAAEFYRGIGRTWEKKEIDV
ncbi:MAG TPA: methionyl-tRNA formyltransferase [Erysipelotrichaceae bacterium]|nr:methionyl-tRNA formyltransferase [Erysipelotrichaceae bacterium]